MSAGFSHRRPAAALPRSRAPALLACLVLAIAAVVVAGDAASASTGTAAATAASGSPAQASVVKRCRTVRVKLRRHGKVVKRNGKPVFRRVRRCKKVPSPGCRFVKVKKRTKTGRVVKRNGKPVYRKIERCRPKPPPPGPAPQPGPAPGPAPGPGPQPGPGPTPQPVPADELANRVVALAQHVPGNIDLFTSGFANGEEGFYPAGSAMAPASGPPPPQDDVRAQLSAYLDRWFGGDTARVNDALALFDDDDLETLAPEPTHRAAIVAMKGTLLEPTLAYLTNGKFGLVRWGSLPLANAVAASTGGSGSRVVTVNNRYAAERFEYLIGVMGHEFLHEDSMNPGAEEAINGALTVMTHLQVLSKSPELAHAGTELARQMNTAALVFSNSKEAGSPNSEIYAPTGLGTAPGSALSTPDFWSFRNGSTAASAGSEQLETILQSILTAGTPIPDPLNFNQATAELFENLNDDWLSDVQRAQLSVLLQLVTVEEIAQATGLAQQQIIDTLGLQPYLDAIGG